MINKNQIPIENYVMSNKGYIKLNGVEILELKECHIKSTPNTKKLNVMNCSSELERKTSYSNEIQFKINKVYSRFKRTVLDNAKDLKETVFTFEGECQNDAGKEERYEIDDCVLKGDINWLDLVADGDFTEETYTLGFLLEKMRMPKEIDDGEDWDGKKW